MATYKRFNVNKFVLNNYKEGNQQLNFSDCRGVNTTLCTHDKSFNNAEDEIITLKLHLFHGGIAIDNKLNCNAKQADACRRHTFQLQYL